MEALNTMLREVAVWKRTLETTTNPSSTLKVEILNAIYKLVDEVREPIKALLRSEELKKNKP